jgi:diguanylate cyclase (GGDEF)-like protein
MLLDPFTLLVVSAFTLAVAAALLLAAWLHQRQVNALVVWAAAFGLGAIATALIISRGHLPTFWTITIANTALACGYGLLWSGARLFDGRRVMPIVALLGAGLWLVAYPLPEVHADATYRAVIMAMIGASYTLAAAFELWRDRRDNLRYRWPVIGLLILHAVAVLLRILLAGTELTTIEITELASFVMFETVLLSMCCAYLLPGMVGERVASRHMTDARIDPLTGINNRRSFIEQGERIVLRCVQDKRPVALLLCDLDHFKAVNDEHGHAAGDRVLIAFCRLAEEQLRPSDLLARLGGEEFVCLLPDLSAKDALSVADRLRLAFADAPQRIEGDVFRCTVSIGLAVSDATCSDLYALLTNADRALYRAKKGGRNCAFLEIEGMHQQLALPGVA